MNLSYKWLKELVKIEAPPEALGEMLTSAGCAVEEIDVVGGDHMLVAEVTTNRPDWLCHRGVAHEIAALTGNPCTFPEIRLREDGPDVMGLTSVDVEEAAREFCPRYTGRVIQGVAVKESPEWLRQRMEAIGQRSINNIVDITNLVCFEMNQPLHTFDYDLLKENRIVVRMARNGESFKAITGEEDRLTDRMLVIADAERAVALAGVKGGANTEVHEGTTNILLEAAWFQPQQVRRTSRATRMDSESSYRFERGIDPGMTERASARAAQLIAELTGGRVAKGVIDTQSDLGQPWEATMRLSRCEQVLGIGIDKAEVVKILAGLGLEVLDKGEDLIRVTVPSFRQDLTREIDLIEEVVRVAGYDRVPVRVAMGLQASHETPDVAGKRLAREVLVGLGYFEAVSESFVPEKWLARVPLSGKEEAVRVLNPVNAERPLLRTSLLPSLLDVRRVNRELADVRLFELGRSYNTGSDVKERSLLALLDDGGIPVVRGALETVVRQLHLEGALTVQAGVTDPRFQDGSGAALHVGETCIGTMGLVSDEEAKLHDLTNRPGILEVDFGSLIAQSRRERRFHPLPRFPAVKRDIALVVPESVQWLLIEQAVNECPDRMEEVIFQSVYRGKGVKDGCKSMAFTVTFRAPDRSLTDVEANGLRDAIVEHLKARIEGAELRQ